MYYVAEIVITVMGPPLSPWATGDIGDVGVTGNAGESVNGAIFEVSGAGQYIYYTADAFRYLYQQISGNCTIVARITS